MKVVKPKRIELTLIVYGIAADFNTKYKGSAIIGVFPRHFGCFMVVLDGCYFSRLGFFGWVMQRKHYPIFIPPKQVQAPIHP
jgi:hypothetical protein